jgi:hypothetical protein
MMPRSADQVILQAACRQIDASRGAKFITWHVSRSRAARVAGAFTYTFLDMQVNVIIQPLE